MIKKIFLFFKDLLRKKNIETCRTKEDMCLEAQDYCSGNCESCAFGFRL